MKHFIIITNRPKDPDLEITRRVQELLKLRQASCSVYADEIPKEEWKRILLREGDRTDAILVLGGDGTMLRAARDTGRSLRPPHPRRIAPPTPRTGPRARTSARQARRARTAPHSGRSRGYGGPRGAHGRAPGRSRSPSGASHTPPCPGRVPPGGAHWG